MTTQPPRITLDPGALRFPRTTARVPLTRKQLVTWFALARVAAGGIHRIHSKPTVPGVIYDRFDDRMPKELFTDELFGRLEGLGLTVAHAVAGQHVFKVSLTDLGRMFYREWQAREPLAPPRLVRGDDFPGHHR